MPLIMKLTTEFDEFREATEASLVSGSSGCLFVGTCQCKNHVGRRKNLSIRVLDTGNISIHCRKKCEIWEVYEDLKKFGERVTGLDVVEPYVKCPKRVLKSVGKMLGQIYPKIPVALAKIRFSPNDFLIYAAQRSYSDESVKGPSYPLISTLSELTGLSKSAITRSRRNLVAVQFVVPEYHVKPPLHLRKIGNHETIAFETNQEAAIYISANKGAVQSSTHFSFPNVELNTDSIMPDDAQATPFDEVKLSLLAVGPKQGKTFKIKIKRKRLH